MEHFSIIKTDKKKKKEKKKKEKVLNVFKILTGPIRPNQNDNKIQ